MSVTDEPSRKQPIEVAEEPEFQRRDWRVQRVSWAVLMGVAIVAALGLLGGTGPFATRTAVARDGSMRVEYSAIGRHRAPGDLTVELSRQAIAANPAVQLWIDRDYLASSDLLGVVPEPAESLVGTDRITYTFAIAEGASDISIVFELEPVKIGRQPGRIGIVGGPELSFSTLVLP